MRGVLCEGISHLQDQGAGQRDGCSGWQHGRRKGGTAED